MLFLRARAKGRPAMLIGTWIALLTSAFTVAGRTGLGTLLTAAFVLQVTPSIWTAYRTAHPTGIARGTWMLISGEVCCWTIFGLHKSDPRLVTLGVTGVNASALMLARIHHKRKTEQRGSQARNPIRTSPARARRCGRGMDGCGRQPIQTGASQALLAVRVYTWYTYSVCPP
jgi:hypothetical protein